MAGEKQIKLKIKKEEKKKRKRFFFLESMKYCKKVTNSRRKENSMQSKLESRKKELKSLIESPKE